MSRSRSLPARYRRRRRVFAAAVVLVLLGLVGWSLLGGVVFAARGVDVTGAARLPGERVAEAAAVPMGTPLILLDTGAIEQRVAALRPVAAARVGTSWSGTVRIEITERTPVVVIEASDGLHLVDASAVDYETVPRDTDLPGRLPVLRMSAASPADRAAVAATTVVSSLPPELLSQVAAVRAESAANVVLELADGREVEWGDASDNQRKAEVLPPLLTQPGEVYDVSSPELPTIA